MIRNRRATIVLLTLILVLAVQAAAFAAIKVIAEPGVDPDRVAVIQKTVDAFNDTIGSGTGVTLDRDIRVFVCSSADSYRDILIRELAVKPDLADRTSKVSSGMAGGSKSAVAIKFAVPAASPAGQRYYFVTAHELFHQLEYQLAGKNMGKSLYWLKEGAADLLGAAVAEKLGYQSLEKWKLDRINTLRRAENHVSPQDILHTNLDRWTAMMEQKRHPYEMSDLMVFYLMNEAGTGGYRAICEYYRLLGRGLADTAAFQQAFGMSPAAMVAGFQRWFADVSTQAATVEVIAAPDIPAQSLDDFNSGVGLSRRFFSEIWGGDLKNSMRFVLVSGKPAFAAAIAKEFGVSAVEAQQRAKNSTWWFAQSTVVYDIGSLSTKRQRIYAVADSLARRFANETAIQKNLEQLYWLAAGAGNAVAAHIVEQSGAYTKAQYRQYWLNSLATQPSYPTLAELVTAAGYNQARVKHGATAVNRVSQLAALYLLDKHGPTAFNAWFKAAKETGSAETAFQQAFGISVVQFYDEFAAYLGINLKKAS